MTRHVYRTYTATVAVVIAAIVILAACSSPIARSPADRPAGQVQTRIIATGLQAPWGLAFLPDGRALVSERDSGRLVSIDTSGTVSQVQRLPADGTGEGGLLGIALSPNYASDGLVYAYYSTARDNRVVRFRLGEPPQPILTGIPVSSIHNGAGSPLGWMECSTAVGRSLDRREKIERRRFVGSVTLVFTQDDVYGGDTRWLRSLPLTSLILMRCNLLIVTLPMS